MIADDKRYLKAGLKTCMVFGVVALLAAFQPVLDPAPECWCRVENVTVLDADTFRGDLILPWGITLRNQTIRANDYDAVESSKRRQSVDVTDAEVELGKRATSDAEVLVEGGRMYVSPGEEDRDNYGRLLGSLLVVTKDGKRIRLKDWANDNGYVRGG